MDSTPISTTRVIKKYPNRRLYDTQASSYVTLLDVKKLVMAQEGFTVVDAKTGDDLTHTILLQIILDEEAQGVHLLSSGALSEIIRYYGHAMQGVMGAYLEKNIQVFSDIQDKLVEKAAGLGDDAGQHADQWVQFMNMQGPLMQGMMHNYIEQSKALFLQMQGHNKTAA